MSKNELGQRIKSRRKAKTINQTRMAYKLEITQATYSRYESGDLGISISHLLKICEILGTNPNELLEWSK